MIIKHIQAYIICGFSISTESWGKKGGEHREKCNEIILYFL